jgi:hypothetical protein
VRQQVIWGLSRSRKERKLGRNVFDSALRRTAEICVTVVQLEKERKMGHNIFYQCTRDDGKIVESVETGKQREENGPEYFLPVYARRRKNC